MYERKKPKNPSKQSNNILHFLKGKKKKTSLTSASNPWQCIASKDGLLGNFPVKSRMVVYKVQPITA